MGTPLSSLPTKTLSLQSTLMLGFQILNLIETLHLQKIIVRVICPDIVSIWDGHDDCKASPKVNLNQLAFSKYFIDSWSGEHIKPKKKKTIFSQDVDIRFISQQAAKCYETSRRDDIESLGYFLYFMNSHQWTFRDDEELVRFKNMLADPEANIDVPSGLIRLHSIDHQVLKAA